MVYRKKHLDFLTLRYNDYYKKRLKKKLFLSIQKNFYTAPKIRVSLGLQNKFISSDYKFYKTQNKLRCMFTYTRSVPSKRLQLSRFYMVLKLNNLLISGAQK